MDLTKYLNKNIKVIIDRPFGSKHPKYGFIYPVNYGYVPNTISGDGEELDCYVLGIYEPVNEFVGKCIAIIHRTNDNDDKLIIVPEDRDFTNKEIEALTEFQERFFKHKIIRDENTMNKLYIITGPAGVGKSTISKEIAKNKSKSALIEGDEIYAQVIGGYVPAWKEGNHLEVFWKICLENIETYLKEGYDVVFNYIITPEIFDKIKKKFQNYSTKFIVLITDEETILDRDNERIKDCRMGERCIILLNKFKNYDFEKRYFLDTTNLTIEEIIKRIENNNNFTIKRK